jgi:hypothetical protein
LLAKQIWGPNSCFLPESCFILLAKQIWGFTSRFIAITTITKAGGRFVSSKETLKVK